MGKIELLDCTLRDGGYLNDWRFGKSAIKNIVEKLISTNTEIVELGFFKNEPYCSDRTVFNSMDQVKRLICPKKNGLKYAVMCEVTNPLPIEMLSSADSDSADIIRVIVWKTKHDKYGTIVDALEEGYKYCKGIVEKGYQLCVQPARVEQYSDEEFVEMVKLFQQLNPLAIYVVDSWGTQSTERLLHYMQLADQNMDPKIALGYHGHNNMMQTYPTMQAMLNKSFRRNIMIDASIYGIGRGAGNLNLEIAANYLNVFAKKNYLLSPMMAIYEQYIADIYKKEKWGYATHYFLTALYQCNPNYGRYYANCLGLSLQKMEKILSEMKVEQKTMFSEAAARELALKA